MKASPRLHPDEVMTRVSLCSVRLNQAPSVAVEVVTAVVPLLGGEAMKPLLSISLGKQTQVALYTAVVEKVATPPLPGEATKLLLSPCYASLK